ncbi:type II secretion system minor pseudopilin GspK [Roseovarius ramblicola]|uniref:Type II secretion system protein K n=1 Tax=Roseovarius ramblicola TaxID=2022336 RepID=A0ABV5HW90_9RHOB
MRRDRGIALLNALVMVAAIATLAAGLMIEAGRSHDRMAHVAGSQQAALHLDAGLLLVDPVLRADWLRAPDLDHLAEPWARAPLDADIDRGRLVARLSDLQGRFNVNSLANASDTGAARAFERLLRRLDLPVSLGAEIAGFVQPRGPVRPADYAARAVPVRVPGGAAERVEALRLVRGMTAAYYARLVPYIAALPPGTPLNVNTALPEVLAAVLPAASPADIDRLVAERRTAPFAGTADFETRARRLIHPRVIARAQVPDGGFDVSTRWFEARFVLHLDGRAYRRILTIERSPEDGAALIAHRRMFLP